MEEKRQVKISVRNLVEFILRSGNIDASFIGSSRAVEGTRVHKKLQESFQDEFDKEYESEVTLKYNVEYEDLSLTIEGRADGIIEQADRLIIDEIKTTTAPLEIIDEDFNPLHWAQAKCYAFIYAKEHGLDYIDIRLIYYQLDTEEIKYIVRTFQRTELEAFFSQLANSYYLWAKRTLDWESEKIKSIKELDFPYADYRKGQRNLAMAVYKTIVDKKRLFAQAPTGIGKTISTLFPSVKAIGEGHTSKIFYLTAKTITRKAAEEAFSLMRDKGLRFKTIVLTAKEKICFMDETKCTPDECEYAKGHFDRVNRAIEEILTNEDEWSRDVIEMYAREYRVCPFELSLDLTLWADCIICDYNYVFDPSVYLKRFFVDGGGDYVFLIDEAHNLVDRSRDMFSAQLYGESFHQIRDLVMEQQPKLGKSADKVYNIMAEMDKLCENGKYHIIDELDASFYNSLKRLIRECEEFLVKHRDADIHEELLNLYFECISFTRIWELYDERYVAYIEILDGDIRIKLFCLDPSYLLSERLKAGKAAVFFSATLLPMRYYRDILGGSSKDYGIYLDSPFSKFNRCILVANKISTRYRHREKSYVPIAEYIEKVISVQKGNYMVFFPSYEYMNSVYDIFIEKYPQISAYIQEPNMAEYEREEFLDIFKSNPKESTIAFCVLGGIFSEGIDLKADRLIGAIVVGIGLPKICLERNIIRKYFDKRNNLGYEYAYMYPGMNKVLQAAGRVIRSGGDKGVILLIDDRFIYSSYQRLFPKEWFPYVMVNGDNIVQSVKEFWSRHQIEPDRRESI